MIKNWDCSRVILGGGAGARYRCSVLGLLDLPDEEVFFPVSHEIDIFQLMARLGCSLGAVLICLII